MYVLDIWCGIPKGTFEIPHKISYPLLKDIVFVKVPSLKNTYIIFEITGYRRNCARHHVFVALDLRAHKCFDGLQAGSYFNIQDRLSRHRIPIIMSRRYPYNGNPYHAKATSLHWDTLRAKRIHLRTTLWVFCINFTVWLQNYVAIYQIGSCVSIFTCCKDIKHILVLSCFHLKHMKTTLVMLFSCVWSEKMIIV